MKKFYIPIFTAVFLFTSILTQGQVYNSILTNPGNLTLDDPGFWQGGVPPPNPCTGCTITIWTSVTVPHEGGSTYPPDNSGPQMNMVTLINSLMKVQGAGTILTINTFLVLQNNSQVYVGTDPSYNVTVLLNDQATLDATSSVRIGNNSSYIDATNIHNNPIQGNIPDFSNGGTPDAGIFSLIPKDGENYTLVLTVNGNGTAINNFAFYNIGCPGPGPAGCNFGIVNGPSITSLDGTFGVIFTSSTTLPVTLVQFLADKNPDGSVGVLWTTSQEENSSYYDVERSSDQSGWVTLGTVKAKGYSSIPTSYSYTDKLPLDGTGYYRLKMVDLDGKYKYSNTVTVTSSENDQPLVIYSNPFSDQIRMKVNVTRAQNLVMTVSDMVGKTIISQNYHAQAGDNYVNLQPAGVSSGMYVLHIHGDSYDQTVKLAKQ
jgi:hypothetical protein